MTLLHVEIVLGVVVFAVAFGGIIWLEERYYRRHPEKERPEVSMWP